MDIQITDLHSSLKADLIERTFSKAPSFSSKTDAALVSGALTPMKRESM